MQRRRATARGRQATTTTSKAFGRYSCTWILRRLEQRVSISRAAPKMKRILVLATVVVIAAALLNLLTSVWITERFSLPEEVISLPVLPRDISNVNTNAPPSTNLHGDDDEEADEDKFHHHLLTEQHFVVDWTLHYTENQIREKIKKFWPNLSIKKMVQHPMYIKKEDKVKALSKFYNQVVDDFRGETSFNMYFIYDHNPKYDFRQTSKGQRIVNTSMLDLKMALRTEMGGGFKIHATDNIQETKENMKALGMPEEYDQRKFDTLGQIFDVLNSSGLEYVVLRNFEKMPDEIKVDASHLDVDLLVSDYYEAKRLLDGLNPYEMWKTSYENGFYRIVNRVMIDGKLVDFDVRHTGDNYLDRQWQLDILKRRLKLRGMFVPSKEDHLHSLIYHAIIQKPKISETYVKQFKELGNYTETQARDKTFLRERLDTFMYGRGYKMTKPNDKTVGYFPLNIKNKLSS